VGFTTERIQLDECELMVIDMSGDPKYSQLWECYYDDCEGVVFVVDASDGAGLQHASSTLYTLWSHPLLATRIPPLLIVANKSDKHGALSAVNVRRRRPPSRLLENSNKLPWPPRGRGG
jgi:signal recognition particle receptor subunit beta